MNRSVVVTAMAVWSPYGRGVEAFWNGLASVQSSRKPIARFDVAHWAYRCKEGCVIPEIDGDPGRADIGSRDIMDQVMRDLLDELAADEGDISPYDTGLCLGSSNGGITERFLRFLRARTEGGADPELSGSRSCLSSAGLLGHCATQLGAQGPSALISTACASATSAIGMAYDWVRRGRVQRAFAGGYGYFSDVSLTGFNILRLVGKQGCRPFDADRDGMMLGDGFAMVALEEEAAARRRGTTLYGRIAGYCAVNEAFNATSPDPSGEVAVRAMWNALGRSQERLERLDYINAHGTGTPVNDKAELVAIQRLLEGRQDARPTCVSSTKGHHGHSLGATGAVEFIATLLAMQRGCIPATIGLENPEAGYDRVDLVRGAVCLKPIRVALSNSFAFGGNTAAIAIEQAE